jgi:hypothetical protein
MLQSYVNNAQSMQDLNIEMLIEYTKSYNKTQLIMFLRKQFGEHAPFVAVQLELFDKAKKKLPDWAAAGCFFTKKSLEQCSSLPLANFKTTIVKGNVLVDLSAGLGVDDVTFSKTFKKVIGVDVDEDLNKLVRHNYEKLNIKNITRVDATADFFLSDNKLDVDVYFIDADRRPTGLTKTFSLTDATPNVLELVPELLKNNSDVLLKLSPMVDIAYLFKIFPNVKRVYVVGMKNEVKEVLLLLNHQYETDPQHIEAVQVNEEGLVEFSYSPKSIPKVEPTKDEALHFFEPSNMIIKAGLSSEYASSLGLNMVSKNSHYATGNWVDGYFGRWFKILHHAEFNKSGIKQYLKSIGLIKANVSARNFVSTVDEIRKIFLIDDGGEDYLFFTQDASKNKLFWHCVKA